MAQGVSKHFTTFFSGLENLKILFFVPNSTDSRLYQLQTVVLLLENTKYMWSLNRPFSVFITKGYLYNWNE